MIIEKGRVNEAGRSTVQRRQTTDHVAGIAAGTSTVTAVALIVGLTAGFWFLAVALGGSGRVPPHWFYVPIMFSAVRFGPKATLLTSVAAGLVAGPLLPDDVTTHSPQLLSDWGMRMVFFVGIGQVLALLVHQPRAYRSMALRHVRTHRALRRGLAAGEIEVHYQPIFDIRGQRQRIVGAEALVRWNHPTRGMVPPAEFVPAAEATGAIVDVDQFVLNDACARLRGWQELSGDANFSVSVNLSPRDLADKTLVTRVAATIAEHGVDPSWLTLEITETAVMDDIDVCLAQLTALDSLGVRLAIDDFGTGRSSLSYVHLFPARTIKLDRSFISQITTSQRAAALVDTLITLTHSLDLTAVAEGIEDAGQLARLRRMGCDRAQGFYLAKPAEPTLLTDALIAVRLGASLI